MSLNPLSTSADTRDSFQNFFFFVTPVELTASVIYQILKHEFLKKHDYSIVRSSYFILCVKPLRKTFEELVQKTLHMRLSKHYTAKLRCRFECHPT